jgi:hypothetical protein
MQSLDSQRRALLSELTEERSPDRNLEDKLINELSTIINLLNKLTAAQGCQVDE